MDPGYLPLAGAPGAGQLLLRNCYDHFWGCHPLPQPKGNSQETLGPCQQDGQLDPRSRAGFQVLGASWSGRSQHFLCVIFLLGPCQSVVGAPWGGHPGVPAQVDSTWSNPAPATPWYTKFLVRRHFLRRTLTLSGRGANPLPCQRMPWSHFLLTFYLFLIEG